MKPLILAFLLFIATFAVAQEDGCINPQQPVYYKPGWVQVSKEVKAFRHLEMWGISDHSPREFIEADKRFKFHWIETRRAQFRYIHNVIKGTFVFKCGSNDDTGQDHIRVMAGGEVLLDADFGDEIKTLKLDVNFGSGTTVVVMVYNKSMPNESPGAFFVGINAKYLKQVYRRQRALISITF